jgi:membrane-associated phospholipid phosphatase
MLFHYQLKCDISFGMKSTTTLLITMALLATIVSMIFVDKEVASGIWQITSSHLFLHKHFENIPNTLPQLVAIGTTTMWLAYFVVFRKNGRDVHTQFIKLAATAVPVAYLIKIFLQFAFGRTNIRLWLRTGGPIEFSWFSRKVDGGFPSGHMIVFTAFFTAVWLYYPRYRPLVVAALSTLAMALLLTSYHFVSDIVAGMCCGILITASLHHFIAKPLLRNPDKHHP